MSDLIKQFEEQLRQDTAKCRELKIPTGRFPEMLKRHGAIEACIRVIMLPDHPLPRGFEILWEEGRLRNDPQIMKLSAEARVLEWPWCKLLHDRGRDDVLRNARRRLRTFERVDLTACRCLGD